MAREEDTLKDSGEEHDEFVPVVFAQDADEAEVYRQLLEDHDIPAIAGMDEAEDTPASVKRSGRGIPILVPEPLLDEASQIIANREEADELAVDEDDLDEDEDEFELDEELASELDDDLEEDEEDEDVFEDDLEEDEEDES